jgi:hypothetical protein
MLMSIHTTRFLPRAATAGSGWTCNRSALAERWMR